MRQRSSITNNPRNAAVLVVPTWRITFILGVLAVAIFLFAVPLRGVSAPDHTGGPPSNPQQWQLVFADQFGGTSLDTSKWTPCNDWQCHSYFGRGEWRTSNVVVADGSLQLHAKKHGAQPDCVPTTTNPTICTTSLIKTNETFAFRYGYMEARMKLARGDGLWPAFWALPVPMDGQCTWPPEIDVMEQLGNAPNVVHMFYHYATPALPCGNPHEQSGATYKHPDDVGDRWHHYAVEWRPDMLIWYIDGVERHRVTEFVADRQFYLLLDHAFGDGTWNGNQPTQNTPPDSAVLVDEVRVWQAVKHVDLLANPGFEKGEAAPWSTWGNGVATVDTVTRSGTYGVTLRPGDGGVEQVIEGLKPNTTYTLRGWTKIETQGDDVKVGVKEYGGSEIFETLSSTSYAPATITFTTGANTTSAKIFMFHAAPTANGTAYGDDFELVEATPVGDQ